MTFGGNEGFGAQFDPTFQDQGFPQSTPPQEPPQRGPSVSVTVGLIMAAFAVVLFIGIGAAVLVNSLRDGIAGGPAGPGPTEQIVESTQIYPPETRPEPAPPQPRDDDGQPARGDLKNT